MSSRTYSLAAWGTAEDISASPWGNLVGTPTVAAATDPFGGSSAYKITDANAGANEARSRSVGALTLGPVGTGFTGSILVCVKADTATGFRVFLTDTSAANTARIGMEGTVSGGIPSVSASVGAVVSASGVSLGNGWYAFIGTASLVSGNTHRLELYATQAGAANTGATIFYVRNIVLLDLLGSPLTFPRPKEGYEAAIAPSGLEDASSYGDEYPIIGRVSWVPTVPRSFPVIVSGFDGGGESAGINCNVAAMLSAGWNKSTIRFAPDRSACTTYVDTYLRNPTKGWRPELEGNADRAFEMELVSQTAIPGF